jgi:hypothetical protein
MAQTTGSKGKILGGGKDTTSGAVGGCNVWRGLWIWVGCLGFTSWVSFVGCCSGRFAKSDGDGARDFDKLTFGSVPLRNAAI